MSSKSEGTVKWFDNAKGYGFKVNEAREDVFISLPLNNGRRLIQNTGGKSANPLRPGTELRRLPGC